MVISADELHRLIRDAALEAIEGANDARPVLLDRAGLARALDCSQSTVRRLQAEGLPTLVVGVSPRFELGDVLAFLRTRGESR